MIGITKGNIEFSRKYRAKEGKLLKTFVYKKKAPVKTDAF